METLSYEKVKDKIAIRRSQISRIILNVNGMNSPIKRHRVAEWIKKTKPNHILPLGDTSQFKRQI